MTQRNHWSVQNSSTEASEDFRKRADALLSKYVHDRLAASPKSDAPEPASGLKKLAQKLDSPNISLLLRWLQFIVGASFFLSASFALLARWFGWPFQIAALLCLAIVVLTMLLSTIAMMAKYALGFIYVEGDAGRWLSTAKSETVADLKFIDGLRDFGTEERDLLGTWLRRWLQDYRWRPRLIRAAFLAFVVFIYAGSFHATGLGTPPDVKAESLAPLVTVLTVFFYGLPQFNPSTLVVWGSLVFSLYAMGSIRNKLIEEYIDDAASIVRWVQRHAKG